MKRWGVSGLACHKTPCGFSGHAPSPKRRNALHSTTSLRQGNCYCSLQCASVGEWQAEWGTYPDMTTNPLGLPVSARTTPGFCFSMANEAPRPAMLVGSIGAEPEKWQAIPSQNPVRRFGTLLLQNRTISERRHRPEPAKRPAFNTHHSGAVIAPALYPIQHWIDGKAEWDTYAIRKGRVGSHSALPIFAPQSTCPARLISASRPRHAYDDDDGAKR